MYFSGFCGNVGAKKILSAAFDFGRVPHAYLIDGPEGSGKKTLAGIIAAAAVCESDGEKPCGHCSHCVKAMAGIHPDIINYTGGASVRSFTVDMVRKIRLDAYVAPNEANKKVYILSNIHNMTEQAQNALLKILEEPPEFVLFILTTEGRSRVLSTVQSRTALLNLGLVDEDEAVEAIMAKTENIDREQALKAARLSGYIIGRAIKGLESGSFVAAAVYAEEFVNALCSTNQYDFIKLSGKLEKDKPLFTAFIELLPLLLRDAAAIKAGTVARMSGCVSASELLASRVTLRQILNMIETASGGRAAVDRYANQTLFLTSFFSQLWLCLHVV